MAGMDVFKPWRSIRLGYRATLVIGGALVGMGCLLLTQPPGWPLWAFGLWIVAGAAAGYYIDEESKEAAMAGRQAKASLMAEASSEPSSSQGR